MRYRAILLTVVIVVSNMLFPFTSPSSTALAGNWPENEPNTGLQNNDGPESVDPLAQSDIDADDTFENNDTPRASKLLEPGLYQQLVSLDDDWYTIKLDKKSDLSVVAAFSHSLGNIDMQLFQSNGSTKVGESTSVTDNERIHVQGLNAGDYLLKVYAPQSRANDYGLSVMVGGVTPVRIENTENDWYLPPGVRRDFDSGFYRWSIGKAPTETLPIISPGGQDWSWRDLNPEEGVYRFDLIQDRIRDIQDTPYALGLRVKCSEVRFVPDWVIEKHNPPIGYFNGGNQTVSYVSPWHPGVEAELFRFIEALGKTDIPENPKVVFAYIHGISSSAGEELNFKSTDLNVANSIFGLTSEVYRNWAIRRIDAWADAFGGVEYKLMWVGDEESLKQRINDAYQQASREVVAHALKRGISFRGGIIELYYGLRIKPESTGQGLVRDPYGKTSPYYETYFYTDLDFPVIKESRANGDENEEYWGGSGPTGKWGDTLEQRQHRWLMSNLRSLTMGINLLYTTNYAYSLNPELSRYVQRSLGKTVSTSRDAWVFLNEGYRTYYMEGKWRDVAMKNFERYLYQRDLPGARTIAVQKTYRNAAGGENMKNPPWGNGTPFDFVARQTDRANGSDRMYFNVEDRFIHKEPQTVLLKVTYLDNNRGTWHVKYDAGLEGILSTPSIRGTNDGVWKTATFVLNQATFAGQLPYGQDLAIVTESGNVTVKYVRIIKWWKPAGSTVFLPIVLAGYNYKGGLPAPTYTPSPTVTPSPTGISSPTPASTPSLSPTSTATSTPTPTGIYSPTPTSTPTATDTPSPTLTNTPMMTPTVGNTPSPTLAITPVATPTPIALPTHTPTLPATPSSTPTGLPSMTPTPTYSSTVTPTDQPANTNTPTALATSTATATLTPTPTDTIMVTDTPTTISEPLSATPTPTATPSPTATTGPL